MFGVIFQETPRRRASSRRPPLELQVTWLQTSCMTYYYVARFPTQQALHAKCPNRRKMQKNRYPKILRNTDRQATQTTPITEYCEKDITARGNMLYFFVLVRNIP